MAIKVLIVEDHPLVRAGIRALLEMNRDIQIVAEAANVDEALRQLPRHQPDVVLLDVTLPPWDGPSAIKEMLRHHPHAKIIALSMGSSAIHAHRIREAGAVGFVLKHMVGDLEPSVRAVAAGKSYVSRAVRYPTAANAAPHVVCEFSPASLTPRQEQILKLIAQGNTSKEIARQLGISIKTAQTHRTQLMERLDIHNVAGLVRYAINHGLITPEK